MNKANKVLLHQARFGYKITISTIKKKLSKKLSAIYSTVHFKATVT